MRWKTVTWIVLISVSLLSTPHTDAREATCPAGPTVAFTLLHMNDVYELTPGSGRNLGGLARVATVKKALLAQHPNTFTVLAGDLFSPSALGTAVVDGRRLDGRQMVHVMNLLGLDFATFGNHEFDLHEADFLQRLHESTALWITSNVSDAQGKLFPKTQPNHIVTVPGEEGAAVKVGLFGLTIDSNPKPYVQYTHYLDAAKTQIALLRPQVDVLIAITHLPYDQDVTLAQTFPELDMIIGGHEHENMQLWRGANFTPIMKADANAQTVYIHSLTYCVGSRRLRVRSELKLIDHHIPDDPRLAEVIQGWVDVGFQAFEASGFSPRQVIATTKIALDGTEASVRHRPTNLTQLIAAGMLAAAPGAQLAIFNSGSIRIDDVLPPGVITQYDVIRILPFGGKLLTVAMTGRVLRDVLNTGRANKGRGGYLQTANVGWDEQRHVWMIQNRALDEQATYIVAINDFLMTGLEYNLGFLKDNADAKVVREGEDIRWSLINQLRRQAAD
jgi:5'-nucleotidase/UDP-sugar diphosphatase